MREFSEQILLTTQYHGRVNMIKIWKVCLLGGGAMRCPWQGKEGGAFSRWQCALLATCSLLPRPDCLFLSLRLFWHLPQCWTTLHRQHSRNPNSSNYGRIDRGVKIARGRRHEDGHRPQKAKMSQLQISAPTGKLSCWSWYFSCKCSIALLNTTAPAQKGFELQNNLYLFLNIQNLLLSLSYDLVSDFCCLSTVKRAFSALRVSHTPDNVPPRNYSSPSGGGGWSHISQGGNCTNLGGPPLLRVGIFGAGGDLGAPSQENLPPPQLRVNELQKIGPAN